MINIFLSFKFISTSKSYSLAIASSASFLQKLAAEIYENIGGYFNFY